MKKAQYRNTVNRHVPLHYRVDILWWYIAHMKQPGSSAKRFQHLTRIVEAVLVIPHSNAEEERLFSIVRKNKTDSRSCLGLDGTLSNILAMKFSGLSRTNDTLL